MQAISQEPTVRKIMRVLRDVQNRVYEGDHAESWVCENLGRVQKEKQTRPSTYTTITVPLFTLQNTPTPSFVSSDSFAYHLCVFAFHLRLSFSFQSSPQRLGDEVPLGGCTGCRSCIHTPRESKIRLPCT